MIHPYNCVHIGCTSVAKYKVTAELQYLIVKDTSYYALVGHVKKAENLSPLLDMPSLQL